MVGAARFELATPCSQNRCATRLRYAPTRAASLYTTKLISQALPRKLFTRFHIAEKGMFDHVTGHDSQLKCASTG